jgi:RNA polymerase sigma-70 factor (ECF subfamily)
MDKSNLTLNRGIVDDEIIIDLYWQRDENAILETDRKYGKYLYVIAYNILRDSMDCEECLNDTYLCTWNRIPPTRPTALQTFLSRIARDEAVDKHRKKHASRRIPSELVSSLDELESCLPGGMSPEDEVLIKEMSKLISEYLRTLSKREEFVFICRYYYADSISSIANMLDVSENTVFRALAKIRKGLRAKFIEEGVLNE